MLQNAVLYGNITLSQLSHFIVEICGKNALLSMGSITDAEVNDCYKEKGSFLKFRYTDRNSFFGRVSSFFTTLEKEFSIPLLDITRKKSFDGYYFENQLISMPQQFYFHILWHYLVAIAGIRPFENTQNNLSKKILSGCLLIQPDSFIADYIKNLSLLQYDSILEDYINKYSLNYEDLYNSASKFLEDKNDSFLHIKKALQKCRKENDNPTWKVFYALVKSIREMDTTYSSALIDLYFYKNFQNALQYISIKKSDWQELLDFCKSYNFQNVPLFGSKFVNEKALENIKNYTNILDPLIKEKTPEAITQFHEVQTNLSTELPHSLNFWTNWFYARDFVFKYVNTGDINQLKTAIEWYLLAYNEGKYFMGKNAEVFIHEAISVSVYYDMKKNYVQARTRLQKTTDFNSDTKTPLDKNSKIFYDFGLAFDLLLNNTNDAFNLYYHCYSNFWNRFTATSELAKSIKKEDFLREQGIETEKTPEIESVRKSRETLLNISDKKINTLLPTAHNVAYTPISTAIFQGYFDIVEKYMDKKNYPSLNLNIPNTNNCYPIQEIVTQYIRSNRNEQVRRLLYEILDRTDRKCLTTKTNRQKLSPLQEVMQTLDIELNKAFLMKIFGDNKIPDDFLISSDVGSPLYSLLQIKYMWTKADSYFDNNKITNINYENFFSPGFSIGEKQEYEQQQKKRIEILLESMKRIESTMSPVLVKQRKEYISQNLEKLVELYITHTNNVDAFILYSMRDPLVKNQGCTALLYACEMDDLTTCKLLVSAGANLRKEIGTIAALTLPDGSFLSMPNNFIHRAIFFRSWNCLEWFLKDNRSIAAEYMHRKGVNMTYLVLFILRIQDEVQQDKSKINECQNILNRFIPLFLNAGANLQEESIFGSAEKLMGWKH